MPAGEALTLVHPWPDNDAAFEHFDFVSHSFERRGYPLLLVTATVPDETYLARLRAALPPDLLVVGLAASPEVLRSRITAREPPGWVGLKRLLDAASELAATAARLPGVDLALDSDTLPVDDAVSAIRSRLTPR